MQPCLIVSPPGLRRWTLRSGKPAPPAEPGRLGRICDSGIAAHPRAGRAAHERPRPMNAKNLGGIALIVLLLAAVAYALGFHP